LRRAVIGGGLAVLFLLALTPGLALAASGAATGIEHLRYAAGPYEVTPGANLILLDYKHVPKPDQDGFMIRMAPNLRYALPNGKCCGKVPLTSVIHLHHGVWLSNGTAAGVAFDSGELGAGTPGVGRLTWSTPTTLPPGTYTFFCRIHPWMRGVFRIVG
jgi:hypothetical protein